MKHAIMVIGHGNNADILQATINHFDSDKIDFFVHWDKKWPKPTLCAKDSQIIWVKKPLRSRWGTDSLVWTEKLLFEEVKATGRKYDYVHLISAADMPLMTKDYFIDYFTNELYLGFVENVDDKVYRRLSWWYPSNINYRSRSHIGAVILKIVVLINRIFKVNRLSKHKDIIVEKGCQWFSMKGKYLDTVLNYSNYDIFKHTFLTDEVYLQTILREYKPKTLFNDNEMAARYIDWERGIPYVFKNTEEDIHELRGLINTKYAFARKIESVEVLKNVFSKN